ncbi:MAG: hypothetical protein Q9184_004129 [Pyrenodesmia sp. 2 TL-2023]
MDESAGNGRPDRAHVADERGNPFVTFSRLVDQQVSSIFRIFVDFPSSFARPSSDCFGSAEQQRRWGEARQEAEDLERSFNELFASHQKKVHGGDEISFDDRSVPCSNMERSQRDIDVLRRAKEPEKQYDPFASLEESIASCNEQRLYEEIRKEGRDIHEEYEEADRGMDCIGSRLCELYPSRDRNDREPRCPYRPVDEKPEDDCRNSLINIILPWYYWGIPKSCSAQYVDESPYSPVNLETQRPFREHRAKWRKAFEDLLLVSNGQDLSDTHSLEGPTEKWDWINSLAKRDLIGYNTLGMKMVSADQCTECATPKPKHGASEAASTTELGLYERFLGSQSTRAASSTTKQNLTSITEGQSDSDKSSLISTLTTTERRTLPDGSVYTQVVLKKRFSDGREELTETEHTAHGTQMSVLEKSASRAVKEASQACTLSVGHDGKITQALGQKVEEQKKRGWFWS